MKPDIVHGVSKKWVDIDHRLSCRKRQVRLHDLFSADCLAIDLLFAQVRNCTGIDNTWYYSM